MNEVAGGLAFMCIFFGLIALGAGGWILLIAHTHLDRHEKNQCVACMLVGVILITVGYMLR